MSSLRKPDIRVLAAILKRMKNDQISSEDVAQFWDGNADRWATDVRAGWDAYREYYNNPAFLELSET